MPIADEILCAVKELTNQGKTVFSREEIRAQADIDRQLWNASYSPVFQGMRSDGNGRPRVSEQYRSLFSSPERGSHQLTEKGRVFIQGINTEYANKPHSQNKSTNNIMKKSKSPKAKPKKKSTRKKAGENMNTKGPDFKKLIKMIKENKSRIKFIMPCAARKRNDLGNMLTPDGQAVKFVARPHLAPHINGVVYARPDDIRRDNQSWRQYLTECWGEEGNFRFLSQAYSLYVPNIYNDAYQFFGENLYILSAGWGLVSAKTLLPDYDITFSNQAAIHKRRNLNTIQPWQDFNQLSVGSNSLIIAVLTNNYIDFLHHLITEQHRQQTFVIHCSATINPDDYDFEMIRYPEQPFTNWHYTCIGNLINQDSREYVVYPNNDKTLSSSS